MESESVDSVPDPVSSENPDAAGGRRSVWVVLGFVALGVLGALVGVAGYLRQSELLDAENESSFESDDAGEPFVAYAGLPVAAAEPLPDAQPEAVWEAEPVEVEVVEADPVVAEKVVETPVAVDHADEVVAVDVPVLDEAPPKEVPSESGESRIDFEPAALFADPLAMRDRRGSLRR